jgi:O-antigen/teichoic acid export membrane protein
MLTESIYGLVGAVLGIVGLLGLIGEFGIPTATTKYVSERLARKDREGLARVIYSSIFLELVFGLVASILCFTLAGYIAHSVFHKPLMEAALRTIAPMLFFWTLSHSFISTFIGFKKSELFMAANVINSVTRLVASVTLVFLGYGLVGAVAGYVFGSFVGLGAAAMIFYLVLKPKHVPRRVRNLTGEVKTLLFYGAPVTLGTAAILIYIWSDTLILTAFHPVEYVSWYNIAYGMIAMPLILSRSIKTASLPVVSDLDARKKSELLRETYLRTFKITALIMLPIMVLIGAMGSQLILVLYGEAYLPAIVPLNILLIWGLVNPLSQVSESIPLGLGLPKIIAKIHGITALLNIGLNLLLIPRFAMVGAAVGTTVSYVIGMTSIIIISGRLLHAKPLNRTTGRILASALIMGLIVYVLVGLLLSPIALTALPFPTFFTSLVLLAIGLFAGIAIYLPLISSLKIIDRKDLDIAKGLRFPGKTLWFGVLRKMVR